MNAPLIDVVAHLAWDCDFPHPDWPRIRSADPPDLPADLRNAVETARERAWLEYLRDHLGGRYTLHESPFTFLLTEQSDADAARTLAFIDRSIATLTDALEGAADSAFSGKHVVLLFTEDDDYYSYISHFFPDGTFGLMGGVCIRGGGEVHIAVNGLRPDLNTTLAHELVHDLLSQRPLPQWVEEGVAQLLTRYVVDSPPFDFTPDLQALNGQLWHWHGLETLWSGEAFSRPDDLQHVSYHLAELLVRLMNATNAAAFNKFLLHATAQDAGESACREHFHVSLIHFVTQILGAGPWFPPTPQATPNE